MQRHRRESDAVASQAVQQFRREMQTRRRRRDRTGIARIDRLIVRTIPRIGLALARDIGRQRHFAFGSNRAIEIVARAVRMRSRPRRHHARVTVPSSQDRMSTDRRASTAWPDAQAPESARADAPVQQQFDLRARRRFDPRAVAHAVQPRGNDLACR